MPLSISPTIASININGNTYAHADWENNTPGTLSGLANDISTQITLLELVGILTKSISGNVTLTGPESTNIGFVFTGSLSANAGITFAAGFEGIAQIENQTTGGFSLVCGLLAGTTVVVPPLGSAAAFCDGTGFTLASGVVRTSAGASVTGAFVVSGATTISGALSVTGAVTTGTQIVNGTSSVSGAATFGTTGNILGAATVGGAMSVGGAVTVSGALTGLTANFSGGETVGGALSVVGAGNFASTVVVAGEMTVNGARIKQINSTGETRTEISAAAGQPAWHEYQTAGVTRWLAGKDATSETGSDAGSDYVIGSYNDGGAPLTTPLRIKRVGNQIILALPTSAAGLAAGALWNNVGVVNIV